MDRQINRQDTLLSRRTRRLLSWGSLWLCLVVSAGPAFAAKVVIVLSSDAKPYKKTQLGLEKELRTRGHTSRTVKLKDLAGGGDSSDTKNPDAFVAVGTPAALWLKANKADNTLVAYCMVVDPDSAKLGEGNPLSGIRADVPVASQFKLIAQAMPQARTIGVLYHSRKPRSKRILAAAKKALPKNWILEAVAIDKHESAAEAIEALLDRSIDIVWTAPDAAVYQRAVIRSLLLSAIRGKKPVFGFSLAFVRAGALLGIGVDPQLQGVRTAGLIDDLMRQPKGKPAPPSSRKGPAANGKGKPTTRPASAAARAGNRPGAKQTVLPPRHRVAVNLIVARKLSIELPEDFVKRANHVFGK